MMLLFLIISVPPNPLLTVTIEYRNGQLIRVPTGEEPTPGNFHAVIKSTRMIGWFRNYFITRESVPVTVDLPLGHEPGWNIWRG